MELNQPEKAIKYYTEAAEDWKNDLTSPLFLMKTAQVYEIQNNFEKALEYYKRVKKEYPRSTEAQEIDKNIAFVEGMIKK
jgi:TolA-binding protein